VAWQAPARRCWGWLEFLYRGAQAGEKGIIFLVRRDPTSDSGAAANGLGWDLDREIERGMIQVYSPPNPTIMVEGDLLMMQERIEAMGAKRVALRLDLGILTQDRGTRRSAAEKTFQAREASFRTISVGFFATGHSVWVEQEGQPLRASKKRS